MNIKFSRFIKMSALLAILAGIVMIAGGAWGIYFTYRNVVREKIVTPDDASIPGIAVRGPFTLKAQADVIRKHTLRSTGGLTYAEMPRLIPQLDTAGNPVLGPDGNPVMVANAARDLWITSTTLTTALNLGLITYAYAALVFFLGLISLWTGFTFLAISRVHYADN
jgi:hypothetical protein